MDGCDLDDVEERPNVRTASTPSSNTRDDEAEDATVADIDDTEDEDEDEDDEDASGDDEEAMLLLSNKLESQRASSSMRTISGEKIGEKWLHLVNLLQL